MPDINTIASREDRRVEAPSPPSGAQSPTVAAPAPPPTLQLSPTLSAPTVPDLLTLGQALAEIQTTMDFAEGYEPDLQVYSVPARWSMQPDDSVADAIAVHYKDTAGFSCLITAGTIRADITLECKTKLGDTITLLRPSVFELMIPSYSLLNVTEFCSADTGGAGGVSHGDTLNLSGSYKCGLLLSPRSAFVRPDGREDTWIPAASGTTIEVAIAFRNAASQRADTAEASIGRDDNLSSEVGIQQARPGVMFRDDDPGDVLSPEALRAMIMERRSRREVQGTEEGRSDSSGE